MMQHRFPLHRISYCADDKSDKRIFTFIAKEADSNKHHCFVFDSEKCVSSKIPALGIHSHLQFIRHELLCELFSLGNCKKWAHNQGSHRSGKSGKILKTFSSQGNQEKMRSLSQNQRKFFKAEKFFSKPFLKKKPL